MFEAYLDDGETMDLPRQIARNEDGGCVVRFRLSELSSSRGVGLWRRDEPVRRDVPVGKGGNDEQEGKLLSL